MRSLQLLTRLKLPQSTPLVLVAVSIGIATGLGSVAFIQLLMGSTTLFFEGGRWMLPALGPYYVLLLPAIGGLIVGPLIVHFAREAKGHGVPEVMSATVVAVLTYRAFSAESIYTLKLRRQGIAYGAGPEGDLMAEIPVREALTHHLLSIGQEATLRELLRLIAKTGHEWFPVLDSREELIGVVTYGDVTKGVDEGRLDDRVLKYATRNAVCAFSDESLREVLIKFHERDVGHLPVVDPASPKRPDWHHLRTTRHSSI